MELSRRTGIPSGTSRDGARQRTIGKETARRFRRWTSITGFCCSGRMVADFSVTDLAQACPMVSQDMIRHLLAKLRKEGKVEPVSMGRFARWRKLTR
jgi:hypothetical protein